MVNSRYTAPRSESSRTVSLPLSTQFKAWGPTNTPAASNPTRSGSPIRRINGGTAALIATNIENTPRG